MSSELLSYRDPVAAAARKYKPIQSAVPGTTLGPIQIEAFLSGGVSNKYSPIFNRMLCIPPIGEDIGKSEFLLSKILCAPLLPS